MELHFDRIKRMIKFEVDGVEYAARLTNGMLEEIEDVAPKGKSFVGMFLDREMPTLKMVKKAVCIGLMRDEKRVNPKEAELVYQKIFNSDGLKGLSDFYFILLATANAYGAQNSNDILKVAGFAVDEEEEMEDDEKNA